MSSEWRLHLALRFENGVIGTHVGRLATPNLESGSQPYAGVSMTMLLGAAFLRDVEAGAAMSVLTRYEAGLRRAWNAAFDRLNRLRQNALRENCETNPIPGNEQLLAPHSGPHVNPGIASLDDTPPPSPPFPDPIPAQEPASAPPIFVRWVDKRSDPP
ncbi:MAG: hypothetical protein ACRD96_03120 [Bryobacteraceae bacterium]